MAPLYPSFTPTYHHSPYPFVDPTQPHLDCSNQIALVTGAGSGIGEAIALAFAKAHIKGLAILGRTASPLESTAAAVKAISPATDVFVTTADITQASQVSDALSATVTHFGGAAPNILVNNAGGMVSTGSIEDQELDEIWRTFELNVKGPLAVMQAFSRAHSTAAAASSPSPSPPTNSSPPSRITVINIASGAAHLPYAPSGGAYLVSKLAGAKYTEILHYERADWNVFNLQPGVVATELARRAGRKAPDSPELPAGVAVWLARDPRSRALSGKFMWANWDLEELLARKEEIGDRDLLTFGLKGWAEGVSAEDLIARARGVHRDADRKEEGA